MTPEEKIRQVQQLIQQQRYDEARDILSSINHPTARDWEQYMDTMGFVGEKPKRMEQPPMPIPQQAPYLPQYSTPYPQQPAYPYPQPYPYQPQPYPQPYPQQAYGYGNVQQNVNVNVAPAPVVVMGQDSGPGCIVQGLWFWFIGWWASQIAIGIAYLLFIFIVTIPFGVMILNNLPMILALRPRKKQLAVANMGGMQYVSMQNKPQLNLFVRGIYFLLVGWWLTALIVELAWLFAATIIGLPVAFVLLDFVPTAVSLQQ